MPAARLPGQMCPLAGEARQAIFVLGQLDLQSAFAGVGMLSEDVENESGAIQHFDFLAEDALQFALVAR